VQPTVVGRRSFHTMQIPPHARARLCGANDPSQVAVINQTMARG